MKGFSLLPLPCILALAACNSVQEEPAQQPSAFVGTWNFEGKSITLGADSSLKADKGSLPVVEPSRWFLNGATLIQILEVDYQAAQVKRAMSPLDFIEPNWTIELLNHAASSFSYTISSNSLCLSQGSFNRCFTR
jgi:hypothetical protein